MNTQKKNKIKVGVVRGGPSTEYEVSLKTGASVLKNLPEHYEAFDIIIHKDGTWHHNGVPITPHEFLKRLDVVFNALHGKYGEDGKIQQYFDTHGIKYTGSGALGSALGMNKVLSKKIFTDAKLKTAHHKVLRKEEYQPTDVIEIFRTFPIPAVVKPASGGSSIATSVVRDMKSLSEAIDLAFEHDDLVLLEEFISGKEATAGVIDGFRGMEHYSLLPIEIRPAKGKFFDHESKYINVAEEICPGNFTAEEKTEIERMAKVAHKALGLRHYSRSDFIVHPKRGIYILETNTLPGLTEHSLLPKSIKAVGSNYAELLDHLITLALEGK